MMVPRSYSFAGPKLAAVKSLNEKESPIRKVNTVNKRPTSKQSNETSKATRAPAALSPAPPAPSKPVVIPTRTARGGRRKSREQDASREKDWVRDVPKDHDRSLLSPSASALLAMTAIPPPRRGLIPKRSHTYAPGTERALFRSTDSDLSPQSLSSSSPQTWNVLFSPPSEDDVEDDSVAGDTTPAPFSSVRSMSTESMPSLEDDDDDSFDSASNPATPSLSAAARAGRKSNLSTSRGEDCATDHPLLPVPAQPIAPIIEVDEVDIGSRDSQSPPKSRFSLKSNLTASFRAVRSAARSFSNFTAPPSSIHRDDYLSESLLSLTLPYAVERRPCPSLEPPDSAFRRYLNPVHLSASELHFHNDSAQEIAIKSSIQLQSYQPGTRPSEHASAPPVFLADPKRHGQQGLRKDSLDTEDAFTSSPLSSRQREPRENGDFLRMIVLEMNMRKSGKLAYSDPGRARLWLPARQTDKGANVNVENGAGGKQAGPIEAAEQEVWEQDRVQMRRMSRQGSVIPDRWTVVTAQMEA